MTACEAGAVFYFAINRRLAEETTDSEIVHFVAEMRAANRAVA